MFTACKHSCISSSLSLSRELSRFWENNPDHVTRGISGFSLQCYIHIHKEGLRNKLLSVERERCGCLLSGTEGLLCVLGNAGLEARPAASGIPPHRNIFPAAARLLNSSSAPPPKKKIFSWVALLAFPCTFDPWLILGTLNLHVLASAASVYYFHLIKAQY